MSTLASGVGNIYGINWAFSGKEIMFSNNTPVDEFAYARELGVTINLDVYEDIAF